MGRFGFLSLALLSLQAFIGSGLATDAAEKTGEELDAPKLAVTAHTSFPVSEIFGVKLVNGHPTQAVVTFLNEEAVPVSVNFVGGALWSLEEEQSRIVRNLTATKYNIEIPAGEKQSVSYSFALEMHPQDLKLNLVSVVSDPEGRFFTIQAHDGLVSVVEPETSIFDPQVIFLYFFLLACFAGVVYFFYTVWIAPYFPQKRRSGRSGEWTKKSTGASGKAESSAQPADVSPSPAVTSATTYNADWIPAHHINRPEARKVKGSARSKVRA